MSNKDTIMGHDWRIAWRELTDYVSRHAEITIGPNLVSIPEAYRGDFYRLFKEVQRGLLFDNCRSDVEKASVLQKAYQDAATALTASGVRHIRLMPALQAFLSHPEDYLMSLLADPLFELLYGRLGPAEFEEVGKARLSQAIKELMAKAYRAWVVLSLIRLLDADTLYAVNLPDEICDDCVSDVHTSGLGLEEVPDAFPSDTIALDNSIAKSFLVPDVILFSRRLECFASIVYDFRDVPLRARSFSEALEWHRLSDLRAKLNSGRLWPDIAVYIAPKLRDLVLVADAFTVAMPEALLEIPVWGCPVSPAQMEFIANRALTFMPKSGCYVICHDADIADDSTKPAIPLSNGGETVASIQFIDAGFDAEKLNLIIDNLSSRDTPAPEQQGES